MEKYQREWKDLPCRRQGVHWVRLENGSEQTAEWASPAAKQPARWQHYPVDRPDTERKTPVALDGVVKYGKADAGEQRAFEATKLTMAEKFDAMYEAYVKHNSLYPEYAPPVPANRMLKPGDKLELGALHDVEVVELRKGGQDLIIKYRDKGLKYGNPYDNGTAYRVVHWTDVVPLATNKPTSFSQDPVLYDAYRQSTLNSLLHKVASGLDDCPDYQRGYAWTAEDKQKFLASVFEGRELGRFIFVKQPYPQRDQVLDGKQRLNCLHEFFTSQLAYKGHYWHDLSPRDRDRFEARSIQFAELPAERMDREALLRIFLEVNAAGVPQSEEHLTKVRKLLAQEQARKYLVTLPQQEKVADLYDEDPKLQDAMIGAFDNFEYPDYSHLTVANVIRKMDRIAAGTSLG